MSWFIANWHYIVAAVAAIAALFGFPMAMGYSPVSIMSNAVGSLRSSPDDDADDGKAMKRLQERFKRLHCAEGLDAMQTVGQHFWHIDTTPPAA